MKTKARILTLSFTIAAICATAPVLAQLPMPIPPPFTVFDQNNDGVITPAEFAATHTQHMNERAAGAMPMRGAGNSPHFADFDRNGDGLLQPAEFAELAQMRGRGGMSSDGGGMGRGMGRNMPSFADFDLNGDGSLIEKEFYEARAIRIKERSEQGYQMRGLANAPTFAELDQNSDGRIDAQEFAAAQMRHRQSMPR
ncbi:hypothetical protein CKO09_10195 [Chromatium weissei]|nr:hypothetical protein [Chromatium weissei]